MRINALLAIALTLAPQLAQAADPPVVGIWETIDDKTGKPASLVRTYLENGKLYAKVEKLLKAEAKPDQRCVKCDGDKKDKPVVGMVVMWDLSQDGDTWSGGEVLDPENGTSYRCKLKAIGDKQLEVRGFVGISLFGRTQTWNRVVAENAPIGVPQNK